jgi:predicted ATPase/DNA-binding CsgD family transcriptional regulator
MTASTPAIAEHMAASDVGPRRHGPPTTSFVGRRQQLAEIRDRLGAGRLVSLIGPGGVGKTRLARQAGAQFSRLFGDGVSIVELESISEPDDIPSALVLALGIDDQSSRDPMAKVVDHLIDREMLIIVDNCEHVLAGAVTVIDVILRSAGKVKVLTTTRIALGITEEIRYPVPQLSIPDAGESHTAAGLWHYESVQLLVERAEAAVPGFELIDENAAAAARLCVQLEGLPLAIELAVARLRTLTLEQIVDRLSDRFALLTTGSRSAEPRQQTLRALIDWSYALCTPAEQLMWSRVSVFAGGFDLAAVEGICAQDGSNGNPETSILDLLGALVDQSIIYVDTRRASTRRFRMLETIREYGSERLAASGECALYRERHRRYFLALAKSIADDWCGPDQQQAVQQLSDERENLRAVMDNCTTDQQYEVAVELVGALRFRWYADGYLAQGRRWADEALDRPGPGPEPSPARATALWTVAWVCILQGDYYVADRRIAECAEVAAAVNDPVAAAYVFKLRGLSAFFRGDRESALGFYAEAVTALRAVGDLSGYLGAAFQYALVLALEGRSSESRQITEEALAVSTTHGERWNHSYIQWVCGVDRYLLGDLAAAEEYGRQALSLHRVFDHSVGTALMTELLAWVAESAGQFERAAQLLGAASALWERTGTGIAAFGNGLFALHADCEARLRRTLTAAQMRNAWQAGTARNSRGEIVAFALHEPTPTTVAATEPDHPITDRQLEIAELVAQGMTNKDIAERLVLSIRTVESHIERSLIRLGFTSRTQLAAWVHANTTTSRTRKDP